MRDLFRFIQNSHFFFLFLVLETISIFLTVRNTDKKNMFISTANSVTGFILEKTNSINDYFYLKDENNILKKENEYLKNHINSNTNISNKFSKNIENTGKYYQSAVVIKNSIYKPYNILSLNKGKADGIKKDMAVISDAGIVGIVANTSENYCTVISILNKKINISAKIKRTNYFGSLNWDGSSYKFSYLYDIPDHSPLYIGDKIVTSGYSLIFPVGITIGTVVRFIKEGSFYKIKVKLSQDFNKLHNVYIVEYFNKDELIQLEDSTYLQYRFINK